MPTLKWYYTLGLRDQLSPALTRMSKGLRAVGRVGGRVFRGIQRSVFNLKTAVLSLVMVLGARALSKSLMYAARTAENFGVRLSSLLGSVEEGNKLFQAMTEYASAVPFEYEKIMQSATSLAGVMKGGVEEIKKWMPMIGDLAAVTGLTIEDTTSQVIRMYSAGAAAADMFRERGILAMMGFQAGVSYSAEQTRKMMFEAWDAADSQFKDVTKELAKTWDGLVSMLKDAWFKFRKMIMDSGPFDVLKNLLKKSLDQIKKWEKEGKLKEWAEEVGEWIQRGIGRGVKAIGVLLDWGAKIPSLFYNILASIKTFAAEVLATSIKILELAEGSKFLETIIPGINKAAGDAADTFLELADNLIESANASAEAADKWKQWRENQILPTVEAIKNYGREIIGAAGKTKELEKAIESVGSAAVESYSETQKWLDNLVAESEKAEEAFRAAREKRYATEKIAGEKEEAVAEAITTKKRVPSWLERYRAKAAEEQKRIFGGTGAYLSSVPGATTSAAPVRTGGGGGGGAAGGNIEGYLQRLVQNTDVIIQAMARGGFLKGISKGLYQGISAGRISGLG